MDPNLADRFEFLRVRFHPPKRRAAALEYGLTGCVEPGHPDANEEGYVEYPNVEIITEMTDLLAATRAYEANVTVMNSTKTMLKKALEI